MDKNSYNDPWPYWLQLEELDLPKEDLEMKIPMLEQQISHPDSVQNFSGTSSSAINQLDDERREKKRKADKDYRNRQKEDKKKMESKFHKLYEENKRLKIENYTLTREKDTMKEDLDSANNEVKKLTREISELRRTGESQEVIVKSTSETLLNVDVQQELISDLKVKVEAMSGNREKWMIEKEHLSKKVLDLEHQNKLFQVQIQALYSRIIKSTHDSDQDDC